MEKLKNQGLLTPLFALLLFCASFARAQNCTAGYAGDSCQYQVPLDWTAGNITFPDPIVASYRPVPGDDCDPGYFYVLADDTCYVASTECYEWGQLVPDTTADCVCYSGTELYVNNASASVCLESSAGCAGIYDPSLTDLLYPAEVFFSDIDSNDFIVGFYHPLVNGRLVNNIYFNGVIDGLDDTGDAYSGNRGVCNYPQNQTTWIKSVEDAGFVSGTTTCTDVYTGRMNIQDLVSACGATSTNITSYQRIAGVASLFYTDYIDHIEVGDQFFREVRNDFYYYIDLPTEVTAQVTNMGVATRNVELALQSARYVYETDILEIRIRATTFWPYNFTDITLGNTPVENATNTVTLVTEGLVCGTADDTRCQNYLVFTFSGLRTASPTPHCDPSGNYEFTLTLDCRSSFTECPSSFPVTYPASYVVSMNNVCGEIQLQGDDVVASLKTYDDVALANEQTGFAIDDVVYFQATFVGDAIIQVVVLNTLSVSDGSSTSIYPNPSIQSLLSFTLSSSGVTDEVTFHLTLSDDVGSPFADISETQSYTYTAAFTVYYNIGGSRKRDTVIKTRSLSFTGSFAIQPRVENATDAPTEPPTEAATDAPTVAATEAPTQATASRKYAWVSPFYLGLCLLAPILMLVGIMLWKKFGIMS